MSARNASPQNLDELIKEMERTPNSGIAMCHAQGKTAAPGVRIVVA